jgi:hypothetical protein
MRPAILCLTGIALIIASVAFDVAHPTVGLLVGGVLIVASLVAFLVRAYRQVEHDFPEQTGIGAVDAETYKRNQRS